MPARGAQEKIGSALAAIRAQTYPNIVEVVVAAADESTIAAISGEVTVVNNPKGTTPTGLNQAIRASEGEIIVRCDAHSLLPPDYIATAVATLEKTGAEVVGGMQLPSAETPWGRAIAAAMSSRWGAGDARYRVGGEAGPTETVYLGVFRRETFDRLGGFDEDFVRSQDYEFNHRVMATGGTIWFDPRLKVAYSPRSSLRDLARQYFDYGRGKRRFSRKHPGQLKWRQIAPPVLVVAMAAAVFVAPWVPVSLLVPATYLVGVVAAASGKLRQAAALATMHLSWGLGFILG